MLTFHLVVFPLLFHRLHLLVERTPRLLGQAQLLLLLLNQMRMKVKKRCVLGSLSLRQTSRSFKEIWQRRKLQLSVPLLVIATCLLKYREQPSNFCVSIRIAQLEATSCQTLFVVVTDSFGYFCSCPSRRS